MNQVQLYAETFAAINEEPAASEVRRLRSEYTKCYHAVFEEIIVQRRMSLSLSQETARFSIFVPEVFLYPLLSRMNILHTEYRYCHIGSWLLPRFSLHVKYFLHRREDVEIVLGHQAIATRWWRGAEHQTNNNDPETGPLSGGNVEILCSEDFPIVFHYNVSTRYLTIKYLYQVNVWEQDKEGIIYLKPKSSLNFSHRNCLAKKKKEKRDKRVNNH